MSGFSDDWLATREAADHAARDAGLLATLTTWLEHRAATQRTQAMSRADTVRLRVTDLGSGSGSNLRYLMPRIDAAQHWRLIDNDADLLSAMPTRLAVWASAHGVEIDADATPWTIEGGAESVTVEPVALDLSRRLDDAIPDDTDLVTASALLDLFSVERLRALAQACLRADAACLFALSYDGRQAWQPPLPMDARSRELLNDHQRRDKGLGGAAGPDAHAACATAFAELGFDVATAEADWQLDHRDAPLQRALLDGWLEALLEQAPAEREALLDWHRERRAFIDDGRSELRVGHVDLVALPPDASTS